MLIGSLPTFLVSLDLWSIGYVVVFIAVAAAFEFARNAQTLGAKLTSIAVLAWFAIAIVMNVVATTVYVIENGMAFHMLLIGTAPYTLANGTTVSLSNAAADKALVVNNTADQVRFETFHYGSSSDSGYGSSYIAAYSVGPIPHRPDHFGPFDRPPQSVSVRGHARSATRYWLTWQ